MRNNQTYNKIKIGILTFHRADNFGAMLQTYALQNALLSLGYEAEVIDYRCEWIEQYYKILLFVKRRKNLIKWLFESILHRMRYSKLLIRKEKFDDFRKLIKISSSCNEQDKIFVEKQYDLILTGSDQVWSKDVVGSINDWYCYRKHSVDSKIIVASYAASVGNLQKFKNQFSQYKEILEQYGAISVREAELAPFLKKELERKVDVSLDPTLLLNSDKWKEILDKKRIISEPYVLYYDVEENPISLKIVNDIEKTRKKKIVHFRDSKIYGMHSICLCEAGPLEFLNLILYADYIITSSFHATLFSVLFQKKFLTTLHKTSGMRIKNLLRDLRLENHIIEEYEKYSGKILDEQIAYDDVFRLISERKELSLNYLNMLRELV